MNIRKKDELNPNLIETSLPMFMEVYNRNIPAGFPRPSVKILKVFQSLHPMLFKNEGKWSIEKHRKRLMDWLPSYRSTA